ncbi:hypothetical protein EVAR_10267_1 [Eumeta japonica]|uniref:Uncharacterized protein n=1 Tax=Eumeta variegata TaxID=151549 RepID=A0A4C1TDN2_EUMVA|nr:hypothetical protein EVAR_10267_1 [Eumeta japonica]
MFQDIENNSQPNEQLTQPNEESDNDGFIAGNSARRPKPKRTNDDNLVNSVIQSLNDHFKRPRDEVSKEERHDIYCKSIASKLRDLPRQQRMLAEKLMNDVLFEAEWGNWTLDFKSFVAFSKPISKHAAQPTNSLAIILNHFSQSFVAFSKPICKHAAQPTNSLAIISNHFSQSFVAFSKPIFKHAAQPTNSLAIILNHFSQSFVFTKRAE